MSGVVFLFGLVWGGGGRKERMRHIVIRGLLGWTIFFHVIS